MADSIVGGLFGTPEAYQAQQSREALAQAERLGSLDPFASARTSLIYGGRQLAGVLGAQDPQLQLLSQRNAVMREVNPNDPESIMAGAQRLAQFDPVGATALATMAREAEVKMSQVVKNLREGRAAGVGPEGMRAQREAQIQMALRTLKAAPESPENKNAIQLLTDELTALQRGGQGGQPAIAKLQSYRDSLVEQLGANHPKVKEVEQAIKAEIQGKGTTVNVALSTVDKESNMRKDFVAETKPITSVISAADKIDKLLTSNTALGDIIAKKQFNKLAGDNNISNKDVNELANYGDLGQRLAGTLNQFFEGRYTTGQREEALSLVRQIQGDASNQYTTIQKNYRDRVIAENLPQKTSQFIAPDLPTKGQPKPYEEGTRIRNKKTKKEYIVRNGQLVPVE